MEIKFNPNNLIVITKEGRTIAQFNMSDFNVNNLLENGLNDDEINKIKLIINKREFNFYA